MALPFGIDTNKAVLGAGLALIAGAVGYEALHGSKSGRDRRRGRRRGRGRSGRGGGRNMSYIMRHRSGGSISFNASSDSQAKVIARRWAGGGLSTVQNLTTGRRFRV